MLSDAQEECLRAHGRSLASGVTLRSALVVVEIALSVTLMVGAGLLAQNRMAGLIPHLRRIQQPLIAAINGPAYGGGLALALGCDVRIAARSARLCVQFIRVGVSGCDIGTSYLLPRLIGSVAR